MLTNFTDETQREIYIKQYTSRVYHALVEHRLTLDDVAHMGIKDLMKVRRIGKNCRPILEKMKELLKESDQA